jgi:hypothetical protein
MLVCKSVEESLGAGNLLIHCIFFFYLSDKIKEILFINTFELCIFIGFEPGFGDFRPFFPPLEFITPQSTFPFFHQVDLLPVIGAPKIVIGKDSRITPLF